MKRLFSIMFVFVFAGCGVSQNLAVVKATRQDWSGGVAGHHGTNYSIVLKSNRGKEVIDSVYISYMGFKVLHKNGAQSNLQVDSVHHTYTINVGELHNDFNNMHPMPGDGGKDTVKHHMVPVRHFEGAALLVYHYKGKKRLLLIKDMESLQPLNYP